MTHVVWDWNGTLFDDLHIVVDAVNAALRMFGEPEIVPEDYRDHYTRPVSRFYERLFGRELADGEWQRIDDAFHDTYRSSLAGADLAADARSALAAVAAAGGTQSLLSMWWHDELVPAVRSFGIDSFMTRIDGNRRAGGDTKAEHLAHHLAALGDAEPVVVIGDALDDAAAAAAVGTACVLYDGGAHHRHELEAAGVPVASSLLEAAQLAGTAG